MLHSQSAIHSFLKIHSQHPCASWEWNPGPECARKGKTAEIIDMHIGKPQVNRPMLHDLSEHTAPQLSQVLSMRYILLSSDECLLCHYGFLVLNKIVNSKIKNA